MNPKKYNEVIEKRPPVFVNQIYENIKNWFFYGQ